MSYTYLLEEGEASLAESFSDIPAFVLSRSNVSSGPYCSNVSGTESCQDSQSGMMCEHLTAPHGGASLTSCAADSHVRTLAQPTPRPLELTAPEVDCVPKWPGSLARFDPVTRSWKTRQCLLFEDSTECLETLPRWGMTVRGECFPLPTLEHDTSAKDFGYWPTPTKASILNFNPAKDRVTDSNRIMRPTGKDFAMTLTTWATMNPSIHCQLGGKLNPDWQDWLMGWPIKWTDLQPLAMDKFQSWLRVHSESLPHI